MKDLILATCLLIPALAFACSVDHLTIKDPYVRAMPAMHQNSAAYLELRNDSDQPIELVSVSSPVGAKAELHEVIMKDGVAKMQPVSSITIPPKSSIKMAPGGLHIMLLGLKSVLKPGQLVPVTFNFSDGKSKTIEMPVRDMRSETKEDSHQH